MLKHAIQHGAFFRRIPTRIIPSRNLRAPTRPYASVADVTSYPKIGERIHGFTLQRVKHVPELHLTALQLEHDKTGAEYLHIAREDKNNVFAINFKTNPTDSTGLPHILEHVTLCGSEKYPVRDPFFKMMPRTLANFMNAFTSSDYTSYPFATTNKQDFQNLAAVYLDATLHPLLKRSDFLQEGWRLGPENPREPASRENVQFKGVVYNEMKGQMSDASYLYYVRFRDHMFPALHNSGGDPEKMTDLTHEQLTEFSRQHYHPSNAKIFSYGDLNLASHLKQVEENLAGFTRIEPDRDIKTPRDLSEGPLSYTVHGPIDTMQPSERQIKSSLSWLGCESSDIVETFSLSIAASLLMSGYGSPLYEGLIEAGLGSNFSPNSGYDTSARTGILSIGLDGMRKKDVPELRHLIQLILKTKSEDAFSESKVEGYMHQLEIALKHKTAGFGMSMLEKTIPGWFNGIDPMEGLAWNQIIAEFRGRLKEPRYLERLVAKYFLNDKSLQFTMEPREDYNAILEEQEESRRQSILNRLEAEASSPQAVLEDLSKQELDLLHEQENAQTRNLDLLPTLHVNDIAPEKERKPTKKSSIGEVECLWRETSTNGITYFQAKQVFTDLPDELRLLLPLFTECLMRLGTKAKSVGDLEAEILLKTGGISVSPFTRPDPLSLDACSEGLLVDGYALDKNVPAMLDLVRTLILDVDFSSPKAAAAIQELLESKNSGALDSVAESGHHFAMMGASAALSKRGLMQDQLSGLSQIEETARLLLAARDSPEAFQPLIEKLKSIQTRAISNSSSLSLRIVCEPTEVTTNQKLLEQFLQTLPKTTGSFSSLSLEDKVPARPLSRRLFYDLPFQVYYTGTCLQTASYSSPDKAPLTILAQLLTHNFLHPEVREKGGAYGASASASSISALFTMSSYRDPNPRNSLNVFQNAGIYARDRDWSMRELEESKLGIFQGIDAPMSVMSDGSKEFMYGITEDMDQEMRTRLLGVKKEDVQAMAQKYLVQPSEQHRAVCVLGEKKEWIGKDPEEWQTKHLNVTQ